MPIFTEVSHTEFVAAVHALTAAWRADDWTPDMLVGIGRGGLVPAVFLSHATGRPMLSVDYSGGVEAFADAPLAALAQRTRAGERLLIVDDINDSGSTIGRIRATLAAAGAVPGAVRFAVLIDNIGSAERVDYRARTIDRATTRDWFVFPWEAVAPQVSLDEDAAAVPGRIA